MNCLIVLSIKLAGVEGGIKGEKSSFLGIPMGRGGGVGLCEIFLIDLDPGYVAGEYELSKGVG